MMNTKLLTYGIGGGIIGAALTAVTFMAFDMTKSDSMRTSHSGMSMSAMNDSLKGKTGDSYDEAFIATMIEHHQGALDMARQSESKAKHSELKALSTEIIAAQEREISQMKQWQKDWGYSPAAATDHSRMNH